MANVGDYIKFLNLEGEDEKQGGGFIRVQYGEWAVCKTVSGSFVITCNSIPLITWSGHHITAFGYPKHPKKHLLKHLAESFPRDKWRTLSVGELRMHLMFYTDNRKIMLKNRWKAEKALKRSA